MPRKPCGRQGHVNKYRTGRCVTCSRLKNKSRQRNRRAALIGQLPVLRARRSSAVLAGLGRNTGPSTPIQSYALDLSREGDRFQAIREAA